MKKIKNEELLKKYIKRYKINEFFSNDMTPYMELIMFNRNEHICRRGEKIEYLFFLVEGKTKIYRDLNNGKSLLICFNSPLVIMGDVEFLEQDITDSNVQTIIESYCIAINFNYIRKFALEDCEFLKLICKGLGNKLIRSTNNSSINLLYPLENRLASYILAFLDWEESSDCGRAIFEGNLTQTAELLGVSYRHLHRILNKFCEEKILVKNQGYYEILDKIRLEKLAGDVYK